MPGTAALASGLLGYLLGSIPFGLVIGMWLRRTDVRQYGSGNIGATNVLRVLGPGPALAVLLADVVKGALAAYVGLRLAGSAGGATGAIASVAGHSYPVWLGFKGGKSVATAAGGLLVLAPGVALIELAVWGLIIGLTRYVSLGSVTAAGTAPFVAIALRYPMEYVLFIALAGGLVIVRHRSNIKRLLSGNENKLGQKAGPKRI